MSEERRRSEEREQPVQVTRSGTQGDGGVRAQAGPPELREPRGTAGLPRYRPTGVDELPRGRDEDQEDERRETQRRLTRENRGPLSEAEAMARYEAHMDAEDDRIVRMMQRGRGLYQETRRADALHPHLDSSPENPNDFRGDSSNDSEGTYATPQFTNDTPTWEEDLTWEQEDLEEE
eukprot:2207722-Amphidinium_carterae.1